MPLPPPRRREHLNPRKSRKRLAELDRDARANRVEATYPASKKESGQGTNLRGGGSPGTVRFWIRLLGSGSGLLGGFYAWQTVEPLAGGGWATSGPSGTPESDPAIEVNAVATIPSGTYVEVERNETIRRILFQEDMCV